MTPIVFFDVEYGTISAEDLDQVERLLAGEVSKVAVLPDSENRRFNPDQKVYKTTITVAGVHDWLKPGMNAEVEVFIDEARVLAKAIGYPVLLKARSGGGGRGMRVAHNDVSLVNGFHAARAEAEGMREDVESSRRRIHEERLLRAIFGEKAREVRDVSLKVPHGESGKAIAVKEFPATVHRLSKLRGPLAAEGGVTGADRSLRNGVTAMFPVEEETGGNGSNRKSVTRTRLPQR